MRFELFTRATLGQLRDRTGRRPFHDARLGVPHVRQLPGRSILWPGVEQVEQGRQAGGDGPKRELGPSLPLRAAQVRYHDHPGAGLEQPIQRR